MASAAVCGGGSDVTFSSTSDVDALANPSTSSVETNSKRSTLKSRKNGISDSLTLVNFFKGMIGPGCLSLPFAFKLAGLWASFLLMIVLGFLNNYCMVMIVRCSQQLCWKYGYSHLDFGTVAYKSFAHSFSWLRSQKNNARYVANFSIFALQFGVCCVCYVFIAVHVKQITETVFPDVQLSKPVYMILILPLIVAVNFIRQLKTLGFINVFCNAIMATAILIIFKELLFGDHKPFDAPLFTTFGGVLTAAGPILYAFEGQSMVLPLENQLRHPENMPRLLSVGMLFTTVFYATIGFFGYAAYGDDVKGSITLNMPDEPIYLIVKVLLMLVVYFGYALQQYIIVELVWPSLRDSHALSKRPPNHTVIAEYSFRATLVLAAMLIAMAIPNLERIISFVGITTGMLLTFVLPSLISTATFVPSMLDDGESRTKIAAHCAINAALFAFGSFGLIAGVVTNLQDMFES